MSDAVIRNHLMGVDPADRHARDYVIGVYPMLPDKTCWFLAIDFDKHTWREDAAAYQDTCRAFDVPAALERSRSGSGGHVWIFFSEPVPARLARQLGAFMLTQAMERQPELGFDSYDRLFPSQDTLPKGGFGKQKLSNVIDVAMIQTLSRKGKVDDKLQAAQRPFDHRVITRPTAFRLPSSFAMDGGPGIQEVYGLLEKSAERNDMIAYDVIEAIAAGRFPLILSERKDHIHILADMLRGKIENVVVIQGGMGKKQRRELQQVLDGITENGKTVIAATGKYLGEGFDDPRLDTLFLALPISWRGTLAQYAGRLHRVTQRKRDVLIYDYADLQVPVLSKMYGRRVRGYRSIGYCVDAGQDRR